MEVGDNCYVTIMAARAFRQKSTLVDSKQWRCCGANGLSCFAPRRTYYSALSWFPFLTDKLPAFQFDWLIRRNERYPGVHTSAVVSVFECS